MPHIGAAMERSLRPSIVDLLVRSLQPAVEKRQTLSAIPGQINDAKTAFSSWDNCMKVDFCKWPVIAVIIIGGLMIFSVVWCICRCLCCGVSCCCECCYCLKCCGNCCGCCDAPKSKRHKYADDPYAPPPPATQGYHSHAPMTAGISAKAEPPQYAEFDVSKKKDDDALPEMPSWDGASSKKIALEDGSMELEQLKKPENGSSIVGGASAIPTPNPITPEQRSPYGQPQGAHPGANGYFPARSATVDSYGTNNQGYNQYSGYASTDNISQGYSDQGYGMAAGQMGQGRRTPHQGWNKGSNDNYGYQQGYPQQSRSPRPYNDQYSDQYSRSATNVDQSYDQGYGMGSGTRSPPRGPYGVDNGYGPERTRSPAVQQGGYGGYDQRSRTPGAGGYDQRSRTPGAGGYDQRSQTPGSGYGQRSRTPGANGQGRPYAPPTRQYSSDSQRPFARPERQYTSSPVLENTGGFDFNSGNSRPEGLNRRPTDPQQQPQQGSQGGYPGYRAYQPQRVDTNQSQQAWSGL